MSETISIGGVPEHFNLPIHLAIESGLFKKAGINIKWVDFPGGTGAMTEVLAKGTCDICILLTEGIINAILNGNPSKIVSGYVKSPLTWGVHTGVNSKLRSHEEVFDQKIAISRIGSGSHLMPTVDALLKGKTLEQTQFIEVKNIDGAITALNNGETDIFYWEKYTTKPYVTAGKLKRIGEFISPWPCFMIAATNQMIASKAGILDTILKIIHQSCSDFMADPTAPEMVSMRYNLPLKDAKFWFHATEWSVDSWVSDKMLMSVLFTLKEAGIVNTEASTTDLIWDRKKRK